MSLESYGGDKKDSQIDLSEYSEREGDYRVVLVNGEYALAGGTKLVERDGELYVADGEEDAGTRVTKNGNTISSGF
jgi:hypothetical protein